MKTTHFRNQSASSLVVVISILATLMVVAGVAAEYTYTVQRHVQRSNTYQNAVTVGDSCIELLFANWRAICSQTANVTTGQQTIAFAVPSKIPLPTATQLNLPTTTNFAKTDTSLNWYRPDNDDYSADWTISNYKVVATNAQFQALASSSATPEPFLGQINSSITSWTTTPQKTTPLVYNYLASVDVTLPANGPAGKVVARVRRVFQKQQISPWNFALFYVDPLEIHPGPDFTITGPVHTNADLYTGHDTLTFADKVTYGSDWFVGFMPGDSSHGETPTAPNYPSNLPPARDQALQPFGLDSNALFNTTDTNPNNDSYRELVEPPTASPDPLSAERYWNQADVVIQIDNSNNWVIGKPNSNGTISVLPGPSPSARDTALYNMFSGAIPSSSPAVSIQDNREGGSIRLATLDLKLIQNNTSGLNPTFKANSSTNTYFGGVVYIYDNSATTHALNADGTVNPNPTNPVRRGIRIKNGSKISRVNPDGSLTGLTIVSPNPVYIQGDYNTGRDYDGTPSPASNNSTSDPTLPQVTGYTTGGATTATGIRAPCSILADAVTILSNNWDDSKSGLTPDASNTTVNAAIVAGIVPTSPVGGDGAYSGGAENFPRFLENWSDSTLTYYGSMVEIYKSRQSIGEWSCCDVYSPPVRQWYYDMNFKTTPPPGSLMVYSYIKGRWSAQ